MFNPLRTEPEAGAEQLRTPNPTNHKLSVNGEIKLDALDFNVDAMKLGI